MSPTPSRSRHVRSVSNMATLPFPHLLRHQESIPGLPFLPLRQPRECTAEISRVVHRGLSLILTGGHHQDARTLLYALHRMPPAKLGKLPPQTLVLKTTVRLRGDRVVAPLRGKDEAIGGLLRSEKGPAARSIPDGQEFARDLRLNGVRMWRGPAIVMRKAARSVTQL